MNFPRLIAAVAVSMTLVSCLGGGRIDARNPTVSEMDSLDSQWGLSPRKSRGGPRRTYQYVEPTSTSAASMAPAPAAPASLPSRETVNMPPPATISPQPQVDPATVNRLR